MDRMAAMGASGEHPQNCFRALKNLLGLPSGAPTFYWAEIPTVRGPRTPHPFLLPHQFFSAYFSAEKAKWLSTIRGPSKAALEFWRSMEGSDFLRLHPSMPRSLWAKTIPLGMHGDGAAFSHQDSVYTFSWNSLLGCGTTVQKRFVCTLIRKSDMVAETLDSIAQVMSWSFNALLAGESPSSDWENKPLAGGGAQLADGWRGALCQLRGDWAFYKELFHFPQWNSAERMCFMCRASSRDGPLAWVRFGPGAGWRKTKWTHEAYLRFLRGAGLAIPALLVLCVGFRLDCVMVDVLHTVDQGVASHIVANVLWTFAVCRKVFGGKTQQEQVANLFAHMNAWYKKVKEKTKLKGKLTVERLRTKGDWPKLKAKAAATRHLARYALQLCFEFASTAAEDRQMVAVCQLLVRFYEIMESESQFLGAAAKRELPTLGSQLVGIYTGLATAAKNKGLKMWKLHPKLHLFLHLTEWQCLSYGNPRYYWTYADEDLQGNMSEVAKSVHPSTMPTSAMFKWLHIAFPLE